MAKMKQSVFVEAKGEEGIEERGLMDRQLTASADPESLTGRHHAL